MVSCDKKEAKILKEKQTANRPFLPSVAPLFSHLAPLTAPGTRIQFLSFNKFGEKLKRMLAAECVLQDQVQLHHRPETQEQANCPSSGKPRSQAAVFPAGEARKKAPQLLPRTRHVPSALSTPPEGRHLRLGGRGPAGSSRPGLCSRCTVAAGLWPSAPGGGEPSALLFSRRKVKLFCFLPWRF